MKKIFKAVILICLIFIVVLFIKKEDQTIFIEKQINKIIINVNDRDLIVELEDNSSADAFYKRLKKESITIKTHDYGNYEKRGNLGFELPRNDKESESKAGDLMLFQGNKITLNYETKKYNFTKLGHVTNLDSFELKELLGKGDATLKFMAK